jgi:hypothetical protein
MELRYPLVYDFAETSGEESKSRLVGARLFCQAFHLAEVCMSLTRGRLSAPSHIETETMILDVQSCIIMIVSLLANKSR